MLTEVNTGATVVSDLDGVTLQWFATVSPGGRYRGELMILIPGCDPERILDAPEVILPAQIHPTT